jgi:3D (Asp-Asp-Asp) domain-containing protein
LIAKILVGIKINYSEHMKHLSLLLVPVLYFAIRPYSQGDVLGASASSAVSIPEMSLLVSETTISTKTAFAQKIETETEEIPFEIEYRDDPEIEYGEEEIVEPGVPGAKKTNYLVTFWFDEIIDRELSSIEIEQPKTQVTSRGTKVVWRKINTEIGEIKYWRKLYVWATKYDGNCYGCRGLTFSGTLVRKGVCAVDPKVIPLGTNFYVEGYGMCRSEDIGGMIKGKHID